MKVYLLTPERRLNPQFVNRMHQNAEVVADDLAQNFVDLGDGSLRPDRCSELPLHHRKGGFHVGPFVIVRQKFSALELVKVKHLAPDFAAVVTDASSFERNVGNGSELPPSPCSFC